MKNVVGNTAIEVAPMSSECLACKIIRHGMGSKVMSAQTLSITITV